MFPANLTTYQDVMDHLLDYLGTNSAGGGIENRDCRRAILNAYRELCSVQRWQYFYSQGLVATVASQTSGTVAYTNSTRTLTLTGSTWPSWAAYGTILINNVAYQVASRTSDTALVLSVNSNPGADIDAGTAYTIARDNYPMPADFLAADQFIALGNSVTYPSYVHPRNWLIPQQLLQSPASPRRYTFTSDPHYFGTMAVRFHPFPDQAYNFNFIYQRRPRPLHYDSYIKGTVSAVAATQTITGSSTAWTSSMVGATIRLSGDTTLWPDGPVGTNPFQEERVILAVNSATSLTVDSILSFDYTNTKYRISDPVDIEEGAMLTAFFRCCESQEAMTRSKKAAEREMIRNEYKESLILAMEADSRNFATRVAGRDGRYPMRLAYYPRAADIS